MKKQEVRVGDRFKAIRPLHGITKHKCEQIKKRSVSGADLHYDGWLIDEYGTMINPRYATRIG